MTVTLDVDEEIVRRARDVAKRRGVSFDEMVGDLLRDETAREVANMSPEEVISELRRLWAKGGGHSRGRKWTREEIHERKDVP